MADTTSIDDAAAATSATPEGATKKKQRWFPLESNPALMNAYVSKLGFNPELYEFCDVLSVTEDWALEMVPQPVAAVILLYPLTPKLTAHEADEKKSTANASASSASSSDGNVWFIKQRIGNACGTIGLLHALMNLPESLREASVVRNSWIDTFAQLTKNKTPVEKAEVLENDTVIATLHDDATSSETNQTDRGRLDDDLITHFIALVNVDSTLYELDGRKSGPVDHGPTTQVTLLKDACQNVVYEKFMSKDPDEMRFTVLALAPKQHD